MPLITSNLFTYHLGTRHSCVHTTQSLCAHMGPWKSPWVDNLAAGFMENNLTIQLHSIHSHYGPYLKPP